MAVFDVKKAILGKLLKIENLAADPTPLTKSIAKIGLHSAQQAFGEQRLGDIEWPERYPGMKPPIINIAGALQDFNSGRSTPKPTRFTDRPALIDEGLRGGMWGNLAATDESPFKAVWESPKPYAGLHQHGGKTSIPITKGAKERIEKYLFRKRTKKEGLGPRGGKLKPRTIPLGTRVKYAHTVTSTDRHGRRKVKHMKTKFVPLILPSGEEATREGFIQHLGQLLHKDVWTQNILPRPFLGITDESEKDMIDEVERYFQKGQK